MCTCMCMNMMCTKVMLARAPPAPRYTNICLRTFTAFHNTKQNNSLTTQQPCGREDSKKETTLEHAAFITRGKRRYLTSHTCLRLVLRAAPSPHESLTLSHLGGAVGVCARRTMARGSVRFVALEAELDAVMLDRNRRTTRLLATRLLALVASSIILVLLVHKSGVHINITVTIPEPSLQAATPQEEPPMPPEPAPAPAPPEPVDSVVVQTNIQGMGAINLHFIFTLFIFAAFAFKVSRRLKRGQN